MNDDSFFPSTRPTSGGRRHTGARKRHRFAPCPPIGAAHPFGGGGRARMASLLSSGWSRAAFQKRETARLLENDRRREPCERR